MHNQLKSVFRPTIAAAAIFSAFNVHAAQETVGPEIIVTATRDAGVLPNAAQDATVIDEVSINDAGASSITDILANQAGVEVTTNGGPTSTTGIFIRGTKPAQSVVLIDGFRLINPTDGTAPIQGLPLSMFERIEVIRGGASGSYGSGAIGGTIQLFTRNPSAKPGLDASVTGGRYGTYRSDLGYGGNFGDTSAYLTIGVDGTDGFSSTKPSSTDFDPDKDGYHRKSFSANLGHDFGNGQKLRLVALTTETHSNYDSIFAPSAPSVDSQVQLLGLTYDGKLSDIWRTEVRFGETSYDYDYKNAGFAFAPKTSSLQAGWINHLDLAIGRLVLGLEREEQKVEGTGVGYLKNERNIDSAFAQWQASFAAHDVQVALRRDRWTDYGNQNTGSVLYSYNVTPAWSLTGSLAKAFRAPTFDDLYFPFGSNPALVPESSRTVEGGVRYLKGGDEVRMIVFRNRIRNAIELDATFTPQNVQALTEGFTTSWNHAFDNWRWSIAFTHQNPKDLSSGDQLVRRAKNILTGSLERQFGAWRIGSELRSQDERYTQSPNASTNRMGGYGLLNAFVTYAISPALSAQLRGENLTDKNYELVKNYNVPERSLFLTLRYSSR